MPEPGKAAREDGSAITQRAQGAHQALGAFGELDALAHPFQGAFIQTFKQGDAGREALIEIQFSAHGPLSNFCHLIAHSCFHSKFINHFRANQGGVHVEDHQSAIAPVGVVALEGDIHVLIVGDAQEGSTHGSGVFGFATHGNFDAGPVVFVLGFAFQMHPPGQTGNAVDIQIVIRHGGGHRGQLLGSNLAGQQRDDMAIFTLSGHPLFVAVFVNGAEANIDVQFVSFEQHILEYRRGICILGGFHQHAQRQGVVDHGLAYIKNVEPVTGQNPGKSRSQAGAVTAGYLNQNDLAHAGAPVAEVKRREADRSR